LEGIPETENRELPVKFVAATVSPMEPYAPRATVRVAAAKVV
jgi:hypothetical protein